MFVGEKLLLKQIKQASFATESILVRTGIILKERLLEVST